MEKQRKMKRCLKQKVGVTNLILGENIQLNEITMMQQETRVKKFVSKWIYANYLHHWISQAFFLVLGYLPKILVLAKHWMEWTFCLDLGMHKFLLGSWSFGAKTLFMKKWIVDFDATFEKVEISPMWVHLMGLPLIFWSTVVFKEIGKTIGFYYEENQSYISSGYMGIARILVGFKLSEWLVEDITITFKGTWIKQPLDYKGIPFKCGCCHSYVCISRDCDKGEHRS